MQFTTLHFIFFLLIVLIGVCLIRSRVLQQYFLIAASIYFYLISGNIFTTLLISAVLVSYYCGLWIHTSTNTFRRRLFLVISTGYLLLMLGYFKYYNFGISTLNSATSLVFPQATPFELLNIILPVGISFYTFQALSYIFDIYRRDMNPADTFREYILYITFFPQLVAGPIVRAREFLPQIKERIEITNQSLRCGTTLIVWGFFKKIVIADNIAQYIEPIFSNPVGEPSIIIIWATFLFGIQIFCDFSGYSDIAIGIARVMNIEFPLNFDRPYLSANPTEFWRRWHMTLSRFIRDYLYIPLGGNRKGTARTYINLMLTWLICGLWHGAAWNFIAWGAYHGFLLSVHKWISPHGKRLFGTPSPRAGRVIFILSILITQYCVFVGWLLFRVGDVGKLLYCMEKFFIFDFVLTSEQAILILVVLLLIVGVCILVRSDRAAHLLWQAYRFDHIGYLNTAGLRRWGGGIGIMVLLTIILGPNAAPMFIYFQF